mgnify:CR=1 FL=1
MPTSSPSPASLRLARRRRLLWNPQLEVARRRRRLCPTTSSSWCRARGRSSSGRRPCRCGSCCSLRVLVARPSSETAGGRSRRARRCARMVPRRVHREGRAGETGGCARRSGRGAWREPSRGGPLCDDEEQGISTEQGRKERGEQEDAPAAVLLLLGELAVLSRPLARLVEVGLGVLDVGAVGDGGDRLQVARGRRQAHELRVGRLGMHREGVADAVDDKGLRATCAASARGLEGAGQRSEGRTG